MLLSARRERPASPVDKAGDLTLEKCLRGFDSKCCCNLLWDVRDGGWDEAMKSGRGGRRRRGGGRPRKCIRVQRMSRRGETGERERPKLGILQNSNLTQGFF